MGPCKCFAMALNKVTVTSSVPLWLIYANCRWSKLLNTEDVICLLKTLSTHLHKMEVRAMGPKSFASEAPGFLGMGTIFEVFHDLDAVHVSRRSWNSLVKTPFNWWGQSFNTRPLRPSGAGDSLGLMQAKLQAISCSVIVIRTHSKVELHTSTHLMEVYLIKLAIKWTEGYVSALPSHPLSSHTLLARPQ